MEALAIIASFSFMVCVATILLSCAACKKLFGEPKEEEKKDEEAGVSSGENGFSNPAYDLTKKGSDVIVEKNVDIRNGNEKMDDQGNAKSAEVSKEKHQEGSPSSDSPLSNGNMQVDSKHNEDNIPEIKTSVEKKEKEEESKVETQIAVQQKTPKVDSISESESASNSLATNDASDDYVIKPEWEKYGDVTLRGGWRAEVQLVDLLQLGLISTDVAEEVVERKRGYGDDADDSCIHDALTPYLLGESPIAGILISETGEKKTIFKSAKEGILRRGAAISLLEAQAATGSIIDPHSGRRASVSDAYQLGLFDKIYETVVSRAERAVIGYKNRITKEVIPLGEAMERGLVIEAHGLRLLEAQLATGGIIDHRLNLKLPIDLALKRDLIGKKAAERLIQACEDVPDERKADHLKTFSDPNTEENVTYRELLRRSVKDDNTGLRLFPLDKLATKRHTSYPSYSSFSGRSSLASSRSGSKENIPEAVASDQ